MKSNEKQNQKFAIRHLLTGLFAGAILAVMFIAGFLTHAYFGNDLIPIAGSTSGSGEYPLLSEVQSLLNHAYLREQPDTTEREYGAIRGLLSTLQEPNTFFIEPSVAQSEADVLAGTYGGIGVLLQRNEQGEFIMHPYPDSPAEAAGIQPGDVLLAINGVEITLQDHPDAIDQQLRGEVKDDNGVEIRFRQGGETQEIFIVFDVINVPSVLWRILEEDNRLGYVQILRFTSRTPEELRTALAQLFEEDVEGLLLDLRGNGGGLFQESIEVADEFLDGGIVTIQVTRLAEEIFEADAGGDAIDIPLIVLVDNRTASASELVAGAIQDQERGILIGQRTYGKGTVQQIFTLSDGSSVHITYAEWFTPNRSPIAGEGLIPDIEMIPDENGRDVELGEAVRTLQQALDSEDNG